MAKAVLMDSALPGLPVDPLDVLRQRRSAKWRTYPADVLPLTVAEMDFNLAAPVSEALREAVNRSDSGYAMPVPDLGEALAGFAGSRWNCDIDPGSVMAVTDVCDSPGGLTAGGALARSAPGHARPQTCLPR